jgi:3-hydroxybutyrate dehydrogenase
MEEPGRTRKSQGRIDFMHETHFTARRATGILNAHSTRSVKMNMHVQEHADVARALADKVAVVTGSTSGIGLGIAQALAQAGADVVINGLGEPSEIERVLAELEGDHPLSRIVYNGANLMKGEEAAGLVEQTIAGFGRVDILVNNAGIQHVSPIESFPPEKYEAIIALNLSAAWYTTRAAFAAMKQNGFGRIINVASAHGLVASPFKSAYVAAKHGVLGLTKTLALEGAEHNVTCNAICPGYVWTPLVENQIDDTANARGITREEVIRDVLLAAQPNKRFAEVAELGALTVFLCGPGGRSITGTALPVDGGWTAH